MTDAAIPRTDLQIDLRAPIVGHVGPAAPDTS